MAGAMAAAQAAPAGNGAATQKTRGQLLDEIMDLTEDTRARLGKRWGVPPTQVWAYGEQFIALARNCPEGFRVPPMVLSQFLQLASEHDLNPARYEIRAFYDFQKGLTTFVMVDGWITLANRHPQYDGHEFDYERAPDGTLVAVVASIWRKDRTRPSKTRCKLSEWRVGSSPQWQSKPEWMLEQKALKQGIRRAFGFAGIVDDDDARQMGFDVSEPAPERAGNSAPATGPTVNLSALTPAAPPPADEYTSAAPPRVHVDDVKPAAVEPEEEPAAPVAPKKARKQAEPAPEPVTETAPAQAPKFTYGERLEIVLGEAGYDSPLARKRMCEVHKIDDTKLVAAMNGKGQLDADTTTKLEAAGVNVKGLA